MDESIESKLRSTRIHGRAIEGRESNFTELYKECQRNHAAALGWHATDGCNEYIHNTAYLGMYCEACGCHRNFHNKVLVPVKKIEGYQPNAKQYSDNGVRDSGMISETRMVCDQGNKKECDRMTKEEPLLVQKGFEGNQTNQIQGGILSTPGLAYSPFMIFMNEFREKCRLENNFCGVALTCGQKWKSMTFAERAPYVAMAEKRMAGKTKCDELKDKYDESSSKSNDEEKDDEESNEEDEDDEEGNEEEDDEERSEEEDDDEESSEEEEEDDEESNGDDDDEESSDEEEDDEERSEEEDDDEESSEEDDEESNGDDDDEESSDEEEDDEESNDSNPECNDEESDEEEDVKESDEEVDDGDSDESYFESNGNDNDDEEEIVFVISEPDRAFDFELITADTGCGEEFKAPDSSDVISKQLETSAISEDNEDVDETGMQPKDIELVMKLAEVSRSKAVKALKAAEGDLVEAIMVLTP